MPNANEPRRIEILLVEDNLGDARLIQETLGATRTPKNIRVTKNGIEAMDYLRKENHFGDSPRPDIIILDLNLPRKSGHDVLSEIKQDESLRRIPVIIISSSSSEKDINKAYDRQASCYIIKPSKFDDLQKIMSLFDEFWLSRVALPER